MSETPAINWQQLDLITDKDRELGTEFILMFLENAHVYVAELTSTINSPEEFAKICHKIKGAARSVGVDGVGELALQGEDLAKANHKQVENDFKNLIEMIVIELKNIKDTIS